MNKGKALIFMVLIFAMFALTWGTDQAKAQAVVYQTGVNGYYIPDYFATPNWANSPPLTKFVDTLAPLGCTTPNNLGQCIPIAVPDQLPRIRDPTTTKSSWSSIANGCTTMFWCGCRR